MKKESIKAWAVIWKGADNKYRIDDLVCKDNCYFRAITFHKGEAIKHLKKSRALLMKEYGTKEDIWEFKVVKCEIILTPKI